MHITNIKSSITRPVFFSNTPRGAPANDNLRIEMKTVLIDTGAKTTCISRYLQEDFGLEIIGCKKAKLADSSIHKV